MPNGSPGDDPLGDILAHGLPRFTPEIDDLIRRLARLASTERLRDMFDWYHLPPLPEFERKLRDHIASWERQARDRGWEV
jgi:hypothetical protein